MLCANFGFAYNLKSIFPTKELKFQQSFMKQMAKVVGLPRKIWNGK